MTNHNFTLDMRLEQTSILLARHQDIQIRLAQDARFFWLLLIPESEGIQEWHDMDDITSTSLEKLAKHFSKGLKASEKADKINIGALGNIVSQFHLHIVVRTKDDAAWPGPIWGCGVAEPLDDNIFKARKNTILALLTQLKNS